MMPSDMPDDPNPSAADAAGPPERRGHRGAQAAGVVLVGLALAVGVGEWAGWPFLGRPAQHWLTQWLDRSVSFTDSDNQAPGARFHFLGGLRIDAPLLRIGAPAWQVDSSVPTLQATGVRLSLRYRDLWRAWRGGDLRIQSLSAASLDARLERRADGRASWQFGVPMPHDTAADQRTPARLPRLDTLQVDKGTVQWIDAISAADVKAELALTSEPKHGGATPDATTQRPRLTLIAQGHLRKLPLKLELLAHGPLPLLSDDAGAATQLHIDGHWGTSSLEFDGKAVDVLHANQASGRFLLKGPSLASVGDPFGITLPTTGEFRAVGQVVRRGQLWNVVFDDASVGSSKLKGAFLYDAAAPVPVLSGRLAGTRLHLSDLAPTVGAGPATSHQQAPGKVLPDRPFDLPSLRMMQANVLIDVQEVDLDTDMLEPLRPLQAHLTLTDGVLRIDQIDTRTAQGRLQGSMQLDGRQEQALWRTDLRWSGVELSDWIHQKRPGGAPPYISGKLDGSAQWTGKGRSTAQILGSLNGPMRVFLRDGQVSHLAIEVAGIDVFQGLGLLIAGDDLLTIGCGAAEMTATDGVLRPNVFVVDTVDSVALVDGTVSLADETLDLRVVVTPKDFSLITLRSPLRVQGGFANPKVSLEPSSLGAKLVSSVLLGLINPLAALIPLIDPGDPSATAGSAAGCRNLASRIASRPVPPRSVRKDRQLPSRGIQKDR